MLLDEAGKANSGFRVSDFSVSWEDPLIRAPLLVLSQAYTGPIVG